MFMVTGSYAKDKSILRLVLWVIDLEINQFLEYNFNWTWPRVILYRLRDILDFIDLETLYMQHYATKSHKSKQYEHTA